MTYAQMRQDADTIERLTTGGEGRKIPRRAAMDLVHIENRLGSTAEGQRAGDPDGSVIPYKDGSLYDGSKKIAYLNLAHFAQENAPDGMDDAEYLVSHWHGLLATLDVVWA